MSRNYFDQFTIDGVDVVEKAKLINYRVTDTKEDFSMVLGTCELLLNTIDVVPNFAVGNEVIISRGLSAKDDFFLLKGTVNRIEVENSRYIVDLETRFQKYNYKLIKKSYDINTDPQAGKYSAIFQDIVEDGGLSASVEDSGTTILAQKYICNNESRLNRLERIRDVLNWQMYDDLDNDYIKLEPSGYNVYGTKLIVGTNITNVPVWKEDLTPMRNVITVEGATEEDTLTESFNGTGSQAVFELDFTPEITECTVGGVLQTQGIPDQDIGFDYSVDKDLKKFTFESGSIPAIGTNNVVMKYTSKLPRPVSGKDYISIGKYKYEKEVQYLFQDVLTVQDAKVRLEQLLSFIGNSFVSTELYTFETDGLKPGMIIEVEDPNSPTRNGNYVVLQIKYQYPEPFDLVKVASTDFSIQKIFQSINVRLEELERGTIKDFGILNELFLMIVNIIFENRYFKLIKLTPDSGVLYWDTEDQGLWGNDAGTNGFNWGDDSLESVNDTKIVQGNNDFRELIYDTDFYDSAASNGIAWDVTANVITIGPHGNCIIGPVDVGQLRSFFTLNLQSNVYPVLNIATVFVSGDNKVTWQEVTTLNVRTAFDNNDGTGVYIKIYNPELLRSINIRSTKLDSLNINKACVRMILE